MCCSVLQCATVSVFCDVLQCVTWHIPIALKLGASCRTYPSECDMAGACRVAVSCSVAVCCSKVQCCSVLQYGAVRCIVLQCDITENVTWSTGASRVAVCYSVLQCIAVCCSVLQMCCSVLQCDIDENVKR